MMCAWPIRALGDICDFSRGLTYAKTDEADFSANIVLRANNVDLATGLLNLSDLRYIDDKVVVPASKRLKKGALLICTASGSKSHVGKIAYIDADYGYAFGGFMGQIVAREGIDPRYLYYVMRSPAYTEHLSSLTDGANINNLKFRELATFGVPIPPIAEQERIVAILDEAFGAIATAMANAEKSLANARALPSVALATITVDSDRSVEHRRLGDLVVRLTNGFVGPTRDIYVSTGVPYLLARHVRDDNLIFDGRTYVTSEFNHASKKSILLTGDVLLVQSGHIGHSAVVPREHEGHNCHAMIVITPKDELLGEYLSAYFNSEAGRRATAKIRTGSTVPHLTCKDVRNLLIPIPDIPTQRALVARHGEMRLVSAELVGTYRRKLTLLADLKQSILHRALSGDLTPAEALAA